MDSSTIIEQSLILVDRLIARGVPANVAAMAASNVFANTTHPETERGRVIGADELMPNYVPEPITAIKKEVGAPALRLPFDPKEIVRYFPAGVENAMGLSEIARDAGDGSGITRTQLGTMRIELLERGWVTQDAEGRWFRTAVAEEFVNT